MWLKIANLLGVDRWVVWTGVGVLAAVLVGLGLWRVHSAGYDAGERHVQAQWDEAERQRAEQAFRLAGDMQLGMDVTGTELVTELQQIRADTRPIRERIIRDVQTVEIYRDPVCSLPPDRLRDINLLRARTDPGAIAVDRGTVPAAAAPR